MGYRSQVVIAIPKEVLKKNVSILTDLEGFEISQTDDTYYFSNSHTKWYDEYEEVKRVMEFVDNNSDDVGFVRIGEESGDIEERGNNYDHEIYVNTSINMPSSQDVEFKNLKLLFGKSNEKV